MNGIMSLFILSSAGWQPLLVVPIARFGWPMAICSSAHRIRASDFGRHGMAVKQTAGPSTSLPRISC